MKTRVFQLWGHGLGEDVLTTIEGKTLGQIVDKALAFFTVLPEAVHGIKLEVDGLVIKLKRSK